MLDSIVQEITAQIKENLPGLLDEVQETLSFDALERSLQTLQSFCIRY